MKYPEETLGGSFGGSPEWLPTEPPRPAPALMTASEAATYLRLDEGGRDIGDALKSLEYLVGAGRLRPCRVGRYNRFTRAELDRFMHDQTRRYGHAEFPHDGEPAKNDGGG